MEMASVEDFSLQKCGLNPQEAMERVCISDETLICWMCLLGLEALIIVNFTTTPSRDGTAVVDKLPYGLTYVANLEHGDHAVLFYDNLGVAAEYFCAYVEEGIYRNEATFFICPSRELYETIFEQVGVGVASLENSGYLTYLSFQDFCMEGEQLRKGKMLQCIRDIVRTRLKSGSNRMRLITLTGSISSNIPIQDLFEYEQSIGTRSPYPTSLLCCYDARKLLESRSRFFTELVGAHGHCVFQGLAMPTSFLLGMNDSSSIKLGAEQLTPLVR
jgi:hypothetical protein